MYSSGKDPATVGKGNDKNKYKSIRYTEAQVGPEAWMSFNLQKYNHFTNGKKDEWDSYLIEVSLWGDNSDTMISSMMNIDLQTFDEAEAVSIFEKMLRSFIDNVEKPKQSYVLRLYITD